MEVGQRFAGIMPDSRFLPDGDSPLIHDLPCQFTDKQGQRLIFANREQMGSKGAERWYPSLIGMHFTFPEGLLAVYLDVAMT